MTSDLLEGDQLSLAVTGYRTATLLLALVVILLGANFLNSGSTTLFEKKGRRSFDVLAIIVGLYLLHLGMNFQSLSYIGKNRADLLHDYKLLAEQNNLRIFGDPEKTSLKNAKNVLDEALYYQDKLENQLGTLSKAPITIWLHASNEDKLLYTGAKNVHFALPKHREIHISGFSSPHSVLGHELAHIDVGELSTTIFGLPGPYLFIPNLALTEGIPMALTKELSIENGLSLVEQARALYQGDLRVNLSDLFSENPFHFAKVQPRISYIYAGAMIEFLLEQFPKESQKNKLKELIAKGSLRGMYADDYSWATAQASFMEKLKEPMRVDAILWAKRSFTGSSILLADCSETSQAQRAELNIAALNLDVNKYSLALSRLPKISQKAFIDRAIDEALLNLKPAFALQPSVLDIRNTLPEKDTKADKEMLGFKKLDALVGIKDINAAGGVLNQDSFNEDYFSLSQKRLLAILLVLFHDTDANERVRSLSKAAIGFLFSRSANEAVKVADLSYIYGQNQLTNDSHNQETILFVKYILARFSMRQEHYREAKKLLRQLLEEKERLPKIIERESYLMSAKLDMETGNGAAAIPTLLHLEQTSTSVGEREQIHDMIARIKFREAL